MRVGQLYRDFPAKEAIVAAIVEADLVRFLDEAALRRAVVARDLAVVRQWIVDFVCGAADRGQLIPEICAEAARNPRVAAIMEGVERRVRGDLLLALAAFAPAGDGAGDGDGDGGGNGGVAVLADLILTLKVGIASQVSVRPDLDTAALCRRIERLIDAELSLLDA